MKLRWVLLAILVGIGNIASPERLTADETKEATDVRLLIPAGRAYEICRTLASDRFFGRLTGHAGYTAASRWAADRFREWGVETLPGGMGGYLQPFPSPHTLIDKAEMDIQLITPPPGGETISLRLEKDFLPMMFSDSGERSAEVVFIGWGISAPELGYDDYAGVEVKDRYVLCFRGTPDADDKRFQSHDEHRTRLKTAAKKGALGLIYIYPEVNANPNGDWLPGMVSAMISEETADRLLAQKKKSAATIKNDLLAYRRPLSFLMPERIRLKVESRHFPAAEGYNIIGFVSGSDPQLKKECVVLGAHFDHCGPHLGRIFPGANDNASGSAVVMSIAKAFAKMKNKPKRSLLFVLFGGEEQGLTGSHFFVAHYPAVDLKFAAMFNFDMVGEGDGTVLGYGENAAAIKEVVEKANGAINTLRQSRLIRGVGVRSSDYAPFFLLKVPCLSFFSNGPHLAYHQAGDTIFRINPDMLDDLSRLAFLSACFWADR